MTNLVDAKGQPLKIGKTKEEANSVPVVYWESHPMPIRILTKEDSVVVGSAVTPTEVIKEMRAAYIEMVDRFNLLATGFAAISKENPGGAVDSFMSQIGLVVRDLQGNVIYQPQADFMPKDQPNSQE